MLANKNVYSVLRIILDQPQTFEIFEEGENLQLTEKETLNSNVGFGSNNSRVMFFF
jgi:hypothetical protein